MKMTAKIKPLVHSAEIVQKEQNVSIPVRIVEIGQTGRRGPKGESANPEEVLNLLTDVFGDPVWSNS